MDDFSWDSLLGTLKYIYNDLILFKIQDHQITVSNLIVAFLIVALSFIISRYSRALLRRRLFRRMNLDTGMEFALLRMTHYLVIILGAYMALASINIPLTGFVGLVAVLGVGIGFGLQNIANNFISGIILLIERPIKIGDRITVEDIWGDVVQIKLRTTVVNSVDNISVIIPNAKILDNNLINWTYGDKRIRIHVPVGVAYGSDIDVVTRCLLEAAADCAEVLDTPEPQAFFMEFGDSSLNFELLAWLPDCINKFRVINELNRSIDRRFREQNVEIPFPQRVVHLKKSE